MNDWVNEDCHSEYHLSHSRRCGKLGGEKGAKANPPPPTHPCTPQWFCCELRQSGTVQDRLHLKMWKDCLTVSGVIYCHFRQSPAAKGLLIRRKHWKLESGQRKPWLCCLALEEGPSREPLSLQGDVFLPKCLEKVLPSPGAYFVDFDSIFNKKRRPSSAILAFLLCDRMSRRSGQPGPLFLSALTLGSWGWPWLTFLLPWASMIHVLSLSLTVWCHLSC